MPLREERLSTWEMVTRIYSHYMLHPQTEGRFLSLLPITDRDADPIPTISCPGAGDSRTRTVRTPPLETGHLAKPIVQGHRISLLYD